MLLLALWLRGAKSPFDQQSLSRALASVLGLYHQWVFPYQTQLQWHVASHWQGAQHTLHPSSHPLSHLQSVRPPYVACYPICFSISDVHLGMRPVVLAPYLHGGVLWLLLYGHRDIYVMLLLGLQRHVQVWLLLWVTHIGLWRIHWLLLFLVMSVQWGTTDLWAAVVCIPSSKSMVNIP